MQRTILLVISMSMSMTLGQFPNSQYGQPQREHGGQDFFSRSSSGFGNSRSIESSGGGYNQNPGGFNQLNGHSSFGGGQSQSNEFQGDDESSSGGGGGNIHKFISVHIAPPEAPGPKRPTRPQIPQKPETHYQIVFIKAPTPNGQDVQEVQLPPLPETKTLVYVLLKKPGLSDMVRLKSQPTPKPTPPEVYFIRYKGQQGGDQVPKFSGTGGHGGGNNLIPEGAGYSNPPGSNFESSENEIGPSNQYGSPFRK